MFLALNEKCKFVKKYVFVSKVKNMRGFKSLSTGFEN
jgi:hypothetical protein